MALIKCRECKKEVSSNAKTCPHCGIKTPSKSNRLADRIALVLIAVGIVYACTREPSPEYSAANDKRIAIIQAESRIKTLLKDPDSAEFKDSTLFNKNGANVVCGFVNAKNSFGGYNGWERFIVVGALGEVESSNNKSFDKLWKETCHN